MGKYDTAVRCAQIRSLLDENQYLRAMEEIEEIDFEKVPSIADLYMFAELFLKAEKMDVAKELYYTVYRRTASRPALYRLLMLVIRMGDIEEAKDLYLTYEIIAGVTLDTYELRYRLAKAEGANRSKLIEILEQLKHDEYTEEWGYQLAQLYEIEGMRDKCVSECEELQRWFGSGKIVDKATRLKEKCMNPSWVKPEVDKLPEPEMPDVSDEVPAFAHAPVEVEELSAPALEKEEIVKNISNENEAQKEEEDEVNDESAASDHADAMAEEGSDPTPEEEVVEEQSETEPELESEETEEPEESEEKEENPEPEMNEQAEQEEQEEPEEPEEQEEPDQDDSMESEEEQADEEDETEDEDVEEPQKKGFLKRLVSYFKVDFDDLDDEADFPDELDTYKQQSTAEIDVKAILAEGVDDILDVPEPADIEPENEPEEDSVQEEDVLDVKEVETTQVESLEDKLEEMEKNKKVINLEDTLNLEELHVKSHPLGNSETEQVYEDTSRNGIHYYALKGAIQKMRTDDGCINIALTGGAEGISLAVAKKLFKELKKINYFEANNIGKISADKFDEVDLEEWAEKFIGGCMYITDASCLSDKSVGQIVSLIDRYQKQIVIILEGDYSEMDAFLCHHTELEKKITYKVKL